MTAELPKLIHLAEVATHLGRTPRSLVDGKLRKIAGTDSSEI